MSLAVRRKLILGVHYCERVGADGEKGRRTHVIPPLDPTTGHLPVGRFPASLYEIEDRFVDHGEFLYSKTRSKVWTGFRRYLAAWESVEGLLDRQFLRGIWIAGSFASCELNPKDIDVTPILDQEAVARVSGRPGSGRLRQLIGHREALVREFIVEPFPLRWRRVRSSLHPDRLEPAEQDYLLHRRCVG
ncbi:MAG: DUF6932 family protein [Pseudonocardiaceae bacterium]